MELNSIAALYGGYVDSQLDKSVQGNSAQAGVIQSSSTNSSNGFSAFSQNPDSSQLSPLAQIFSTLQQLQETNPARYQQVTQKIAVNLHNAAQTAQSDGYVSAANQLNQLANDFTDASASGELPNIQDLANAIGGNYKAQSVGGLDSDNPWSFSTGQEPTMLSNPSLNPVAIILNTLTNASGKQ